MQVAIFHLMIPSILYSNTCISLLYALSENETFCIKYLSVVKWKCPVLGVGCFFIFQMMTMIRTGKRSEWRERSWREDAWALLELTNHAFIYTCTKSKSFLSPVGFIIRIIMPLFFKFVQRELEKLFKLLMQLSPPSLNLKLGLK